MGERDRVHRMTRVADPELIGRASELAFARKVLERTAGTGLAQMLLIDGEMGIGKSAFLAAIATQAERLGFISARTYDHGDHTPGATLLRGFAAQSGLLLGPGAEARMAALIESPLMLIDDLHDRLARSASTAPLLIAIDDLDRADRLSRSVLRALILRLAAVPVVWVFAGSESTGELTDRRALASVPGFPAERLRLGPLDPGAVRDLAQDRLGRVLTPEDRAVLDGVGGHPGLALHIIEGLGGDDGKAMKTLTAQFATKLSRDLQDLGEPQRELLGLAAVAGRPVSPSEMAGLLGLSSASAVYHLIEWAVGCGWLLHKGPYSTAFRHDVVRRAVYAQLGLSERQALHRRWAAYLVVNGSSAQDMSRHARAGGAPADKRVLVALREAAAESVGSRPDTARELVLDAFALTRAGDPAWWETGEYAVEVLTRVEWFDAAVQLADTLRGQTRGAEPSVIERLRVSRARAQLRMGPAADAVVVLARAAEDEQALMNAMEAGVRTAQSTGHHGRALCHFQSLRGHFGARWVGEEAMTLQLLDRYGEAAKLLRTARENDAGNELPPLPSLHLAQVMQDFNLGRFEDAHSGARTVIDLGRERGAHAHVAHARTVLIALSIIRGHRDEARAELAIALDQGPAGPDLALVQGWLTAAEGDAASAVRILAPVLAAPAEGRSYWLWWPGVARILAMIGLAAGDDEFVRTAVNLAETTAARNPGTASFEGLSLQLRSLVREDATGLEQACRVLEAAPRFMLKAGCAEDLGRLLLRTGHRAEGMAHLDRAWDTYQELGDRQAMSLVQNAMTALGGPAGGPRSPGLDWNALTPAEIRVARLISDGRTNRATADELGLSVNTVGTHLRSIFAKLGVSSRVQLANAANTHFRSKRSGRE